MLQDILLLIAGVYLAWSLGANNAANIIGTSVGSRTLSFSKAIFFLMACVAVGVLFFSKNVIKTISSGVIQADLITLPHAILALFLAAIWVHFATWKNWPVSINQTIVSTVIGIGIAHMIQHPGNVVYWGHLSKMVGIWLVSPLIGFFAGMFLFRVVHGFVKHRHLYFKDTVHDFLEHPVKTTEDYFSGDLVRRERLFKILMILSAGYMSMAMGASTIASTTGLIYSGFSANSFLPKALPGVEGLLVVKGLVIIGVAIGVITYGRHLIDFIGSRLIKLNPMRGAVIQFSSASVILVCALFGYPVSTTAVFVGAFLGVDSGEDHPHMKKRAIVDLAHSFFVTIPIVTTLSVLFSLGLEAVLV